MANEETVPQMRDRIEQLNAEKATALRQAQEAEATVRKLSARDAFREAGYSAAHGELFAAQNPEGEITPEAVTEFASNYNLQLVSGSAEASTTSTDSEEGTSEEANDPGQGLANFSGGGSRASTGTAAGAGAGKMTKEEWHKLNRDNPAAARDALLKGKVEMSAQNFYVKNDLVRQ